MGTKFLKSFIKHLTILFLILGFTLALNTPVVKASLMPGFDYCSNPLSFFTGLISENSDFGSLAAVGTFFIPTDYEGGAECPFSSAGDETRWAVSEVASGEIHLYAEQTGMFFDWAAGAIYDTYYIENPEDVYVSVSIEGSLSNNSALVLGLMGEDGFKAMGEFGPGTYGEGDVWRVKLSDIVSPGEDGSFKMAFGAAVVAWGEGSSAVFADFSDTLSLSFTDDSGNTVPVGETPGGFSQVPIPGTLLLFAPGLIGIFAFRRKKS